MIEILAFLASVLLAYLIGSFPTSFLLTKSLKGIDIRQVGSKNAGATNVLRAAGKIPALVTLIIDILKGFLVVAVLAPLLYSSVRDLDYDFYRIFLGLVAVCGHIWPVFLGFKGGKGVATTIGVGLAIAPVPLTVSLFIWTAVFSMTKYVSLSSIISLMIFPILTAILNYSLYTIIFSIVICAIVIYKHKENIRRLLEGKENKIKV